MKVAKHYHRTGVRSLGGPYYFHPLAVAQICMELLGKFPLPKGTKKNDLLIAALLHDVVEDTAFTGYQLKALFGDRVAQIVAHVTHLRNGKMRKLKLKKADTLAALLESGDTAALVVKLADRLHNMQTLKGHKNAARQREIAQETIDIFVPEAKQLGLEGLATELVALCKKHLT